MTILKTIQFAGIILLLQAAIPLAALGQHPTGAGTPSAQDPPPETAAAAPTAPAPINHPASVPKTSLADLAWLAGRWQGSWGPRVAQQVWTAPKAGVMMGTFQLAEDDKTLVLELFSMVEEPEGITLHLRHFTSSLVAWEKTGPTILNLASADPKSFVFENPLDGQPKHATITRIDADTYVSRSEVVPEKGQLQVTEITYHRQKEAPPARH
ncbi:MAG: DUF6265 family protein [Candidatus Acidiferrales bacterium]